MGITSANGGRSAEHGGRFRCSSLRAVPLRQSAAQQLQDTGATRGNNQRAVAEAQWGMLSERKQTVFLLLSSSPCIQNPLHPRAL